MQCTNVALPQGSLISRALREVSMRLYGGIAVKWRHSHRLPAREPLASERPRP